jgi:hypothetical protein
MHRTCATDNHEAAAAAAAAEKVAPLLQLKRAAGHAFNLGRLARAVELYERAVAAAEATLPRDSLITAGCIADAKSMRIEQATAAVQGGNTPLACGVLAAAWSCDKQILVLSQHCLSLCTHRFRAGTLFTPTPEEVAYFAEDWVTAPLHGAATFWLCAHDAAVRWPPAHTRAESETRLHAIYSALRTALDVVTHGLLHGGATPTGAQMSTAAGTGAAALTRDNLLMRVLSDSGAGGLLEQLRRVCGLTRAEEQALRRMVDWNQLLVAHPWSSCLQAIDAEKQQNAAADVARHGLRACALPECAQTEPHPKAFKLCGRCRAVVYCCAVHQQQDWRRHKREDGCKAAST